MNIVLLQTLKQQILVHKCPGGTSGPSLLLQTQRVNKTFLLQRLSTRKFKSKNSIKLNSKSIKRQSKFTEGFFRNKGIQKNKLNFVPQPKFSYKLKIQKTLLFILLLGTRGQLIRMQISPGFRQKTPESRFLISSCQTPNRKYKTCENKKALVQFSHRNQKSFLFSFRNRFCN